MGHKGKVDLKCDTPGDGGEYYPNHLPMSGGFVALCNVNHAHMYVQSCMYVCTVGTRLKVHTVGAEVCISCYSYTIDM